MKSKTESSRRRGNEFKAAMWTARHPGSILTPGAVIASGVELGWTATGGIAGGAAALLGGWYRAHPDTYDTYAAPRVRAFWRRWGAYIGKRWNDALRSCELVTTNRKTGEERIPRILRVRSYSPSIDTLHVRIAKGQAPHHFQAKAVELAEALKVQRVAIERIKPQVIGLVIERSEPFTEVIDAPEIPADTSAVDLKSIYVGDDEYGGDWREALLGQHLFIAGATGAGKNSIPLALLRGLAPMVRDGLVRLWIADPKQLEFSALHGIAYRYADNHADCLDLVQQFTDDMADTQRRFADNGTRQITVSRETPLNLLICDELGALLAYGERGTARELSRLLALVSSQGRATGHSLMGLVQEPTKDTVPVRDLFTVRICLRVTSSAHVDMVLGENARLRGALADEIPNDPDTAGIGYVIRQRSRAPMRVRAAYVDDTDLAELVAYVRTGQTGADLRVVA